MNKISILAALFLAITCYATEQECYIHIPPKGYKAPFEQKKMTEEDAIREGWEKISCDEAEKTGRIKGKRPERKPELKQEVKEIKPEAKPHKQH